MTGNRFTVMLAGALLAGLTAPALAQSGDEPVSRVEVFESETRVEALPAGQRKVLRALCIETEGTVRWRPEGAEDWRTLNVDDVLGAGAEISTALRSSAKLRIGLNATVDVHSITRVTLPELVQDGDVLRTRVVVRRGRADFKVDKVGLENDFSVVTPSTTLAVRGTFFSVRHGGLFGTVVNMFDPDELSAAEVRYFTRNQLAIMVRNGQTTTERVSSPVANALYDTIGPPPDISLNPDDTQSQRQIRQDRRDVETEGREATRTLSKLQDSFRAQVRVGVRPDGEAFRRVRSTVGGGRFNGSLIPPGLLGGSGNPGDGPGDGDGPR